MGLLNVNTPIPLYFQLQEILRDKIENGQWKPGEHLPSEEELCEEYKVSRITVRNALGRLELEGFINRSPGKGTIAAFPKVSELILISLTGSYASLNSGGRRISTKVISAEVVEPTMRVQKVLHLKEKDKVSKIIRIRNLDDEPLFWTKGYVPYNLCPTFVNSDFEHHSFYEILEQDFGIIPHHSVRTIETELATSRDIDYLDIKSGTPLNVVTSVCYIKDGTPMEFSSSFFRGDRTKFIVIIKGSQKFDPKEIEI